MHSNIFCNPIKKEEKTQKVTKFWKQLKNRRMLWIFYHVLLHLIRLISFHIFSQPLNHKIKSFSYIHSKKEKRMEWSWREEVWRSHLSILTQSHFDLKHYLLLWLFMFNCPWGKEISFFDLSIRMVISERRRPSGWFLHNVNALIKFIEKKSPTFAIRLSWRNFVRKSKLALKVREMHSKR